MKRCPQCNQTYSNENLSCFYDGMPLALVFDALEETTVIRPSPLVQQPLQHVREGVSPMFTYLASGLFALVVGVVAGAVVAYLKFDSSVPANVSAQPKTETPTSASNSVAENSVTSKELASNRKVEVVHYSDSKPQPLTAEAVRNLLVAWERAQDNRSFATYQACYDSSFVGVKSSKSGRSRTLSYSAWMADRRRMLTDAVNLKVDISDLLIRIEGDTAVAEFDQYYRSLRYSDWGPKEIRVKMTPSGAKIVHEVLKASYPL